MKLFISYQMRTKAGALVLTGNAIPVIKDAERLTEEVVKGVLAWLVNLLNEKLAGRFPEGTEFADPEIICLTKLEE